MTTKIDGSNGLTLPDNSQLLTALLHRSAVMNLQGANNATTPATKVDLAADALVMRNAAGNTLVKYATGTLTCDTTVAGPAVNGRDQAAAFAAASWVHFFFIWNGTTLALIASASLTPTLPAGYTFWTYATTLRFNGSSAFSNCLVRGKKVLLDWNGGATIGRILSTTAPSLTATSFTYASIVPPNASRFEVITRLTGVNSGANNFTMYARPNGINPTWGGRVVAWMDTAAAGNGVNGYIPTEHAVTATYQLDYWVSAVSSTSMQATMDVTAYTISNGDN